jgi:hypothetical protein
MVGHHQKGLDRLSVKRLRLFGKLPNVDAGGLLETLVVQVDVEEILDHMVDVVDRVSNYQWVVEAVLLVVVSNNEVQV